LARRRGQKPLHFLPREGRGGHHRRPRTPPKQSSCIIPSVNPVWGWPGRHPRASAAMAFNPSDRVSVP
jgi:hypothetical protein